MASDPLFLQVQVGDCVLVEPHGAEWWVGQVLHCEGGARCQANSFFQIADVDTGRIQTVNPNIVGGLAGPLTLLSGTLSTTTSSRASSTRGRWSRWSRRRTSREFFRPAIGRASPLRRLPMLSTGQWRSASSARRSRRTTRAFAPGLRWERCSTAALDLLRIRLRGRQRRW